MDALVPDLIIHYNKISVLAKLSCVEKEICSQQNVFV
jgi:hypothetical protein